MEFSILGLDNNLMNLYSFIIEYFNVVVRLIPCKKNTRNYLSSLIVCTVGSADVQPERMNSIEVGVKLNDLIT